jgi:hypothetical protein
MLVVYGILEDSDVFVHGDEVRCATPFSSMTQAADPELDSDRMAWTPIYPYWVGRTFGEYKNGAPGLIEGRRRLPNKKGKP